MTGRARVLTHETSANERACRDRASSGRRPKIGSATPAHDRLLMAVAERRDHIAFAQLFERFAPRIQGWLRRSGVPAPLAEDVTQDVMLTLWQRAGQFDPRRATAATWIFAIARNRLIDVFPAAQQEQIRVQLAATLQGVVTQALLPTVDGKGRVAALEILLPDDAVRNLIRQAKVEQIYSVMQTNVGRGMQTLEQALVELIARGVITEEVALSRSSRPEQLIGLLERNGLRAGHSAEAGLRVAEG